MEGGEYPDPYYLWLVMRYSCVPLSWWWWWWVGLLDCGVGRWNIQVGHLVWVWGLKVKHRPLVFQDGIRFLLALNGVCQLQRQRKKMASVNYRDREKNGVCQLQRQREKMASVNYKDRENS